MSLIVNIVFFARFKATSVLHVPHAFMYFMAINVEENCYITVIAPVINPDALSCHLVTNSQLRHQYLRGFFNGSSKSLSFARWVKNELCVVWAGKQRSGWCKARNVLVPASSIRLLFFDILCLFITFLLSVQSFPVSFLPTIIPMRTANTYNS